MAIDNAGGLEMLADLATEGETTLARKNYSDRIGYSAVSKARKRFRIRIKVDHK